LELAVWLASALLWLTLLASMHQPFDDDGQLTPG
jgi:hypothetical protein